MTNTLPDGKAGASLLPGTQVGEYIIDAKLGEGGFGRGLSRQPPADR
jgi:hypothetical protein